MGTMDMHLTHINATVIDITINMFVIVMAMTMTIVIVTVIVSVLLLITINTMISKTNQGNAILTIVINMITNTIMYNTIAFNINDTTSSPSTIIIKK